MSDGPHQSLRLAAPWRKMAKYAARAASSDGEVAVALGDALAGAARKLPARLRRLSMFAPEPDVGDGEPLGILGRLVVEQEHRFANGGAPSLVSKKHALAAALRDLARRQGCSMVEHWLRKKSPAEAQSFATRIREVCLGYDYDALAARLVENGEPETPTKRPREQVGLDDGPLL